MNREQQLTEAFVSLTDTVSDDVDPLTLLRRLVDHCVRLTTLDAAGVMLANARGQLRPLTATEDRATLTELFQAQIAQGPCVDAFTTGIPVHAGDLAEHEPTWPEFVPLAQAAGYAGAHAFPLRVRHQTIGALNLLAHAPMSLTPFETTLLSSLAHITTTAVVTWSGDPLRPADIVTRTQAALSGKALLDTAAGMLAATAAITPREAAHHLHTYAAHHRQRPTDVADLLVRRRLPAEAVLPAPR
ncbi:GAF domain-containing protein [Streptomyces sp. NPDC003042]